jgi:hypothetical protein
MSTKENGATGGGECEGEGASPENWTGGLGCSIGKKVAPTPGNGAVADAEANSALVCTGKIEPHEGWGFEGAAGGPERNGDGPEEACKNGDAAAGGAATGMVRNELSGFDEPMIGGGAAGPLLMIAGNGGSAPPYGNGGGPGAAAEACTDPPLPKFASRAGTDASENGLETVAFDMAAKGDGVGSVPGLEEKGDVGI